MRSDPAPRQRPRPVAPDGLPAISFPDPPGPNATVRDRDQSPAPLGSSRFPPFPAATTSQTGEIRKSSALPPPAANPAKRRFDYRLFRRDGEVKSTVLSAPLS